MSTPDLSHVVLSWPKHLANTEEVQKSGPRRSWIQMAKTGSFTSNRYGKFSITKNDLSQMLLNFQTVTPTAPTELPIDYDHLSMDPKKPGDGIAAGWMKRLALRKDGDELWAEVEWTEPGAERIERGEYRFVSPSFVKDHTHKDGRKIGTTLLAAAITNHPFLEGMSALTLYNFSALGDLAMDTIDLGDRSKYPDGKYPNEEDGGSSEDDERETWPKGNMVESRAGSHAVVAPSHIADALDKHYGRGEEAYKRYEAEAAPKLRAFQEALDSGKPMSVNEVLGSARALLESAGVPAAKSDKVIANISKDGKQTYTRYARRKTSLSDIEKAVHKLGQQTGAVSLSEVGQRVMIAPGNARTLDETGATFEIAEVIGEGDDSFASLKDVNGAIHKWFRATELLPASATPMPGAPALQAPGMPGAPGVPGTPGAVPVTPGTPATPGAPAVGAPAVPGAPLSPEDQLKAIAGKLLGTEEAPVAPGDKAAEEQDEEAEETAEGEEKADSDESEAPAADAEAGADAVPAKKSGEDTPAPPAPGTPAPDDEKSALLKAVGSKLGISPEKKVTNMMKFMLRNDKNEEVEVTADQLEAAGIRVVPDGASVIGTEELSTLRSQVTSLSSQVTELSTTAAENQKTSARVQMTVELNRLSQGGFITKLNRDYAEKKYVGTTDLSGFNEWAGQFATPLVRVDQESGSGGDDETDPGKAASQRIVTLANTIAKEQGISLRDAVVQASAQLPEASEQYRESFAK